MKSIVEPNTIYTISYSQPAEYHFSLDSVFLPQRIDKWLEEKKIRPQNVADMCSGSGVVGLELLFHLCHRQSAPKKIDFIEIQNGYVSHFEKNKQKMQNLLNDFTPVNLILGNYENLIDEPGQQSIYDLIVCNPPYFHLGEGTLSPSEFKNRCRYFIDSDFSHLLKWFKSALTSEGSAFLLIRTENSMTLSMVKRLANQQGLAVEVLGDVRGSEYLRMSRLK